MSASDDVAAAERLAVRCELRDRKLRSIMENPGLSVEGQALAIAMVVTLDLGIFADCATALREAAAKAREMGA